MRDRNLRIHLALGVLAGAFVAVAPLAPADRAVLVLCVAAVIAAEAVNTAVEAVVDLVSPGWSERARIAKDAAAGAVLALAVGSVLAFLAIAAGRWRELLVAPELRAAAIRAVPAALFVGVLPWRTPHAHPRALRAADVALSAAVVFATADLARLARAHEGTAAVALCAAIALSAARRKARLGPGG